MADRLGMTARRRASPTWLSPPSLIVDAGGEFAFGNVAGSYPFLTR
jgi:hypothetical protein